VQVGAPEAQVGDAVLAREQLLAERAAAAHARGDDRRAARDGRTDGLVKIERHHG
jgi:hypothetical protein